MYEENSNDIPLPYQFLTPTRISVDLRLHDPVLLERCLHVIGELKTSVLGDWFQDFIEFSISQYRDKKKSVSEVKRLVLQDGMKQYAARLFDAIRQSEALHNISPGIAEPLIQEASFKLIMAEANEVFLQNWVSYCQSFDRSLKLNNSILFNIPKWRSRQLYRAKEEYLQVHKFDIHEYILSKCIANGLEQYAFLIGRDLTFLKDRECLLRDQIFKSARFPDEQFVFQVPGRCLRNVYVYREDFSLPYRYQLVDTILISCDPSDDSNSQVPKIIQHIRRNTTKNHNSELIRLMYRFPLNSSAIRMSKAVEGDGFQPVDSFVPYNAAAPNTALSNMLNPPSHQNQPLLAFKNSFREVNSYPESTYVMQSTLVLKASTRYFMWRWLIFFLCTYSWLLRSAQYFFFTVLFKRTPLQNVYKVDRNSGYVYYDKQYYVHTIISFLHHMWSTLHQARRNFDLRLSPALTYHRFIMRPIHWVWVYIIRGLLITIILVIVWPILCVICSTASILIGLLALLVIPLLSLAVHILGVLFWNAYTPVFGSNRLLPLFEILFCQFLIKTFLQFVISILCAFILCPVWFLIRILYAVIKCVFSSLWDAIMFHIVFRLIPRIPCKETCSAKRNHNPDTVLNICFLARPEDILIVLTVQLERLELILWKCQMESVANKPMNVYNDFLESVSTLPLSALSDNIIADSLNTKTRYWLSLIEKSYVKRAKALGVQSDFKFFRRIKLSDRNLKLTIDLGSRLTKYFYDIRILPRLHLLDRCVGDWWTNLQLDESDFLGLCNYLLKNTFGEQFFDCVTEKNVAIPLQVRDASFDQQFREVVLSNLDQQICGSSVRSLYGNEVQSTIVESMDLLKEESCNLIELENEDESLSLKSDILGSLSERLSQRCTVIAASSKNNNNNDYYYDGSSNNEVLNSDYLVTSHNSVIEPPHDPNNVDFPLSVFAPRTASNIPCPLKSCPEKKVSCGKCTCNNNELGHCSCISLTKATLEFRFRKGLTETWSSQSFELSNVESNPLILSTVSKCNHYSVIKSLLSTWTMSTSEYTDGDVDHASPKNAGDVEDCEMYHNMRSLLSFNYGDSQWCYCCHHWSTWNDFDISGVNRCSLAFRNIIQHIARVYHPCVIILLLHSRDRENCSLDTNHPSIHKLVRQITLPKKQMKLLKKIYAEEKIIMSDLTGHLDSLSHKSDEQMSCLRKNMETDVNSMSLDSVNCALADRLPSFKQQQQQRSQQLLKSPVSSGGFERHYDSRAKHRWYSNMNVNTSNTNFSDVMNQSLHFQPNWSNNYSHEGICDFSYSQLRFNTIYAIAATSNQNNIHDPITTANANVLDINKYRNPRCYWSGLDFSTNKYNKNDNNNDRDYSGGTPTPSLYGTEDAATTDDLDDTEDIISMSSSVGHSELVDNLLTVSTREQKMTNDMSNAAVHPQRLPLAIPELLTISATSAGSGDTQSQLESEIIDDFSGCGMTLPPISSPRRSLAFHIDPVPEIQSGQSTFSGHSSHDLLQLPSDECTCSLPSNSHVFFDSSPSETVIINRVFNPSSSSNHLALPDNLCMQLTEEVDSSAELSAYHHDNTVQANINGVDSIKCGLMESHDQNKNFETDNVSHCSKLKGTVKKLLASSVHMFTICLVQ
ncbi:unnamed protein product [Heterobilharzia americana]|nr:unnamed protein product [Heterobilharzia americana]